MLCLIFESLSSTNFTWSTLEYFAPFVPLQITSYIPGNLVDSLLTSGISKPPLMTDSESIF